MAVVIGIPLEYSIFDEMELFHFDASVIILILDKKGKKFDIILFPKYGYLQKKIHHSLIKLLLEEKLLN